MELDPLLRIRPLCDTHVHTDKVWRCELIGPFWKIYPVEIVASVNIGGIYGEAGPVTESILHAKDGALGHP
jgi:hypothetical protein